MLKVETSSSLVRPVRCAHQLSQRTISRVKGGGRQRRAATEGRSSRSFGTQRMRSHSNH